MSKKLDLIKYLIEKKEKIFNKELEATHLLAGENVLKGKKLQQQIITDKKCVFDYIENVIYDLGQIIMEKYNYEDEEKAYKYLNNKLNKVLSKEEI